MVTTANGGQLQVNVCFFPSFDDHWCLMITSTLQHEHQDPLSYEHQDPLSYEHQDLCPLYNNVHIPEH